MSWVVNEKITNFRGFGVDRLFRCLKKDYHITLGCMAERLETLSASNAFGLLNLVGNQPDADAFWTQNREIPMTRRTSVTLSKADLDVLEKLKEHYGTGSVSETIRRSISQSSLLKRYSDEDGDLVVERNGKRYVIPSRG
ncbi:MAG: hypothetical protein ABJL55_19700 [Roseibium sp.]